MTHVKVTSISIVDIHRIDDTVMRNKKFMGVFFVFFLFQPIAVLVKKNSVNVEKCYTRF